MKVDSKTILAFAAAALSAYAQLTAGQAASQATTVGSKLHWVTHRAEATNKGRKARFAAIEQRIAEVESRCRTLGAIPLPGNEALW